jgi:hypothetical protein
MQKRSLATQSYGFDGEASSFIGLEYRMINDEMERIWKEAAVALPGGTDVEAVENINISCLFWDSKLDTSKSMLSLYRRRHLGSMELQSCTGNIHHPSLFPYLEKIKVGLCNHHIICLSVCLRVCVYMSPP